MAKLSSATVRLVLKKNRKMRDGSYPVYIVVCFSGRVEKSTGVSVFEKNWDARREVVKGANAPVLNKMLSDIKNRVIERRTAFEISGRRYTPAMLLEDAVEDLRGSDGGYWDICQQLISERRLKDGTYRSYLYTYRKLCEYLRKRDFIVDELTLGVVKDFAEYMERDGIKVNTIKRVLSCVASVWNYAISRDLADSSGYPFKQFKYTSKYKECPRDYFLEESHIVRLKEYWLDMVIERNGRRWSYRPGVEEKLRQRWTREWGILWFLLCYKYGGASPADVVLLKPQNFKRENVGGDEYWKLEFKRKKTGKSVTYMIKRDTFSIISIEHQLMYSTHFVYPVLYYREDASDRYYLEQSHKASTKAIKWVREAFERINEDIASDNAEKGCNEPTVDVGRLVLYTARHSRASNYFNQPGATIGKLATMLGRSASTISTYAHMIKKKDELAQIDDDCAI